MRCEGCDRELPAGAKFCATCGTPVPGLERAAELVAMARTSGLAQPTGMANLPDIPEPAPLPGEALPDLGTPAMPAQTMDWVPSSSEARETLERYRREAAQLLAGSLEEEIEEQLERAVMPEHVGMGGAPQGRMIDTRHEEAGRLAPPPPPPPEREAPEHVAMGERSLTAPMVQPSPRAPVRGDLLADSLRPRSAEQISEDSEATGGKCCAYGCITLAILLALFMLGMLWLKNAEEDRPPPSAHAPVAIEHTIAQAADVPAAAPRGHRGMMPDAQERQHAHSPSPADGRMSDHVLHQLRQADAR